MGITAYLILAAALIPFQGMMADYFSIGDIKPDLGFLAIYFTGLFLGSVRGTLAGGGIGLIADILSGGTGLIQMESGILLGMASGSISKTLLNLRLLFNSLILFIFSLFHSIMVFGFLSLSSGNQPVDFPWKDLFLPKGVFDAFLGSFLFWLILKYLRSRDLFEEAGTFDRLSFFTTRKS